MSTNFWKVLIILISTKHIASGKKFAEVYFLDKKLLIEELKWV
jgi:hypothetical protein